MSLLASSLRKRLALGLASGMVFVGTTGLFFVPGSSNKMRQTAEVGRQAAWSAAGPDQANHRRGGQNQRPEYRLSQEKKQAIARPDQRSARDRQVVRTRGETMIEKRATSRPCSRLSSNWSGKCRPA